MKISIPVRREFHPGIITEHAMLIAAGGGFLLGALIALVSVTATLPATTTREEVLASVGALERSPAPLDLPAPESTGEVSGVSVETSSREDSTVTPPLAISSEVKPHTRTELDLLIADREFALFRVGNELERVRRESIGATAAFSQNCNNWGDYCAGSYKERLDELNTEYARLSALHSELSGELDALRAERGE